MTQIYFNGDGIAYGEPNEDAVCTVDIDTWRIYANSEKGVGWDIIDGKFVTLIESDIIKYNVELPHRESERYNCYTYADEQIAKCDNYILLDIETQKYTNLKLQWLQYKMDVRKTQEQESFPFEVTYPDKPEVD